MGGKSPERDVSLNSGKMVASALASLGHKIAMLDPSKEFTAEGKMFFSTYEEAIENGNIFCNSPTNGEISDGVLNACKKSDKVFSVLHGGSGEDGHLQAVFDCFGIKYTGSGYLASALAMDKSMSKLLFVNAKIPTPQYLVYNPESDTQPKNLFFPCVIKPINGGSSVGVSFAKNYSEAYSILRKTKEAVIIEKKIDGRELTVGVLADTALAVTEIIPKTGFYDYENKYIAGRTLEITPAEISSELAKKAQRLAISAHKVLGLSGYSRTDIMLDGKGKMYVLEVNSLPGMTATSLLPQGAAALGISYGELCQRMLYC